MPRTTPAHADGDDKSDHGARWFATFTFLDAGCAISSSHYRRFAMIVVTAWRRITVSLIGLKHMLNKPWCIGCSW